MSLISTFAGAMHLAYFGVILPYRTWRNRHVWPHESAPPQSRAQRYQANLAHFFSCGVISLSTLGWLWLAGSRAPVPPEIFVFGRLADSPSAVWSGLFPPEWPGWTDLLMGVIACALMVAIDLAYSRRCFDRRAPHMYVATPQTPVERRGWVGQSAAAGVTEELTWRGVQPEMIAQLTGSLWPAVILCAATFGIGHIRQGKPFVAIAALFALIFHALAWLTGGLYVPMLVHVAINVIVGLRAGTWANQRGF